VIPSLEAPLDEPDMLLVIIAMSVIV